MDPRIQSHRLYIFKKIQEIFIFTKQYLFSYFETSPLFKGILLIGTGTAIAQIISIAATPILTRLFLPSDFGILSVYISLLSILLVFSSFRYEFALPLPSDDAKAANLLFLCFGILLSTTLLFSTLLFLEVNQLFGQFHLSQIRPFYYLLIFSYIGAAVYQILNYWAVRQRDYTCITYTRISKSLGGASIKVILGLFSIGPIGLIIGDVVSHFSGIRTLLKSLFTTSKNTFTNVSFSKIRSIAKEYKRFPLFTFPASILNETSLQLPALILSGIYGFEVVGFYSLAYGILVFPVALISRSMSDVYFGEVTSMVRQHSRDILRLYFKTTKQLVFIGIPLIGIPALIAPFFFPIIFGEVWREAGIYCLPLASMIIANFVISPTSTLGTYGCNHWELMWNIARLILIGSGFYLAFVFKFPILIAITLYALIMVLMYAIDFFLNIAAMKRFMKSSVP